MKGRKQDARHEKFHGTREDDDGHDDWQVEGKAGRRHQDPVGDSEEEETGQNWNCVGEGRPKGGPGRIVARIFHSISSSVLDYL